MATRIPKRRQSGNDGKGNKNERLRGKKYANYNTNDEGREGEKCKAWARKREE